MMMRTPMAKLRALLLISLLLCSSLSALTARPNPPSYSGVPHKLHHQDVGADEEAELEPASCEGVEERCLMRKTLNAHIDYIYTQHHKP
ncbi:hypothetical protein SAY87_023954 [Trapa incisa]|nr:hypothetical protein SAY87_023954 [Trapa incisa]